MNDPGLLVKEVEPGVESEIGFDVAESRGEFDASGLEFGTEQINNGVTPHGFKDEVMKISVANPAFMICCQSTGGGGEMDMEITFKIAPERMNGGIDARDKMFLGGEFVDNPSRDGGQFVEKMTIMPEERLKLCRHGECNVLPGCVWKSVKSGFDPLVSGLFSAGGTESRLAGMGRLDVVGTPWADKDMPTHEGSPTSEHFDDINDNGFADQFPVFKEDFPPIAVINEDVPDFDFAADEFHGGKIAKLIVDERKSCHEVKRRA